MEVFLGISAASGTGIGEAFIIPDAVKRSISQSKINQADVDAGWKRFEDAIAVVTNDVTEKLASLPKRLPANELPTLNVPLIPLQIISGKLSANVANN